MVGVVRAIETWATGRPGREHLVIVLICASFGVLTAVAIASFVAMSAGRV